MWTCVLVYMQCIRVHLRIFDVFVYMCTRTSVCGWVQMYIYPLSFCMCMCTLSCCAYECRGACILRALRVLWACMYMCAHHAWCACECTCAGIPLSLCVYVYLCASLRLSTHIHISCMRLEFFELECVYLYSCTLCVCECTCTHIPHASGVPWSKVSQWINTH